MTEADETQAWSDEFERAWLEFNQAGMTATNHGDTDPSDLPMDTKRELNEMAGDLLAVAADEDKKAHAEAIEVVSSFTTMNKNDARAELNAAVASAALEDLEFVSITKIEAHDPDRDPVYVCDVRWCGEAGVVRCEPGDLLNVGPFREKMLIHFDSAPPLASGDEWLEFVNDALERVGVTVRVEDPTRPEHSVAEAVLRRMGRLEVTTDEERFRQEPGTGLLYDPDGAVAFLAAEVVDSIKGQIRMEASSDAVLAVLRSEGYIPPGSGARSLGDGYVRVWEFDPSALIGGGILPAADFTAAENGSGGVLG
jgi:hypothetical protein